ncbi:MAG: ribonuclease P protein component [Bacteroidota bacterium]|jgi:ribonuclease P protein component|nr:ribonuclease P protein component [Bacteroidota bacterium]
MCENDKTIVSKTFHKSERLCSKKLIKELFDRGSSFFLYPIKVFYLPSPQGSSNQVIFSVPKRNIKKAVDRNKIKRRLKESYRSNKMLLIDTNDEPKFYLIAFIYLGKQILPYKEIDDKLKSSLWRLQKVKKY